MCNIYNIYIYIYICACNMCMCIAASQWASFNTFAGLHNHVVT